MILAAIAIASFACATTLTARAALHFAQRGPPPGTDGCGDLLCGAPQQDDTCPGTNARWTYTVRVFSSTVVRMGMEDSRPAVSAKTDHPSELLTFAPFGFPLPAHPAHCFCSAQTGAYGQPHAGRLGISEHLGQHRYSARPNKS